MVEAEEVADVGEPITVLVGVGMGETKALVGVVRVLIGIVFLKLFLWQEYFWM